MTLNTYNFLLKNITCWVIFLLNNFSSAAPTMKAKGYSNVKAGNRILAQQVRHEFQKIKAENTPCPESAAALLLLTLATAAMAARPALQTIMLNQTAVLVVVVGGINAGIIPSPVRKVRKTSHQNQFSKQNKRKRKTVHTKAHTRTTTLVAEERVRSQPNSPAGDSTGGGEVQGRVAGAAAGGSDNHHIVGGVCVARHGGGGGGTASATAVVGNDIPSANKSAAVAFFARMDTVMWQWGGGCCNDGRNNGGGNVVALAVTRAGISPCKESEGGGDDEDAVATAAVMLSNEGQVVDNPTIEGDRQHKALSLLWKMSTTTGGIFPCHQHDDDGRGNATIPSNQRWGQLWH